MKRRLMFMWAAAAALATTPLAAEAQGLLGASGNAGGLLGGFADSNVSSLGALGGAPGVGDLGGGPKGGSKGGSKEDHGSPKGGSKGWDQGSKGGGGSKDWDGGSKGGGPKSAWESSNKSSASYSNKEQASSSKDSGSQYQSSSFNLRDTTLGGFAADPQVSVVKSDFSSSKGGEQHTGSKGGGSKGGDWGGSSKGGPGGGSGSSFYKTAEGSTKGFSASFPVEVQPTTIGGFSQEKSSGSTWDNRQSSYSNATKAQSNESSMSKGFVQGPPQH